MKGKKWAIFTVGISLLVVLGYGTHGEATGNDSLSERGIPQRIIELEKLFSELKETLSTQQTEISDLKASDLTQQNSISGLNQQVSVQQADISNLKNQVVGIQTQISTLNNQLQNLQEQVSKLSNQNTTHAIRGNIVDVDGKTLYSGIYLLDQEGKYYSVSAVDLNTGNFTFNNIPDGTYSINFYYSGYVIDTPHQLTVAGSDISNLEIKLAVKTYTITGQAISSDGTPLSYKQVTLRDPNNIGGYWPGTAGDGSFTLKGIAPGTYSVQIGNPESPLVTTNVTVTDHDITDLKIKKSP